MRKYVAGLGVAALAFFVVTTVSAGIFRDRFMNRHEAQRESDELDQARDEGGAISVPAGARVMRDVAYGPDALQRMDVYLPANATASPVLFMVHGGAWMVGDKAASSVVSNKLMRWVAEGFIMVSVNYRLSPQADPVEQANDVARALAYAQSKAMSWGGDPSRFVLMGHSAGAHLVSLLAADPRIATHQKCKPWLGTVALDSGAFDVPHIMASRHPRFYDRVFKDNPDYWRMASPIYRLSAAGAPMMLVCSTQRQDSCPQARSFAEKITSLGRNVRVFPIDATHREINKNLGLPGEYTDAIESFFHSVGFDVRNKTPTQPLR